MKKVIGIAICDNSNCMSIKGRIPLKIPQYVEYIKRMLKGNVLVTSGDSYNEVQRIFSPKDIAIITSHPENFPEKSNTFSDIKEAIKYSDSHSSPKGEVIIITGPTCAKEIYEMGLYDEFIRIGIDADFPGDKFLDIDFSYYNEIKVTEEFYYSGFSFWYERYDMTQKLSRPVKHKVELNKLEHLEVDISL